MPKRSSPTLRWLFKVDKLVATPASRMIELIYQASFLYSVFTGDVEFKIIVHYTRRSKNERVDNVMCHRECEVGV